MAAPHRLTACTLIALSAAASLALTSTADARTHRHHRHAAKAVLVPAHVKPGYVEATHAALLFPVDLGLGPVFPFGGWPK